MKPAALDLHPAAAGARYGGPAVALHWVLAVALAGVFGMGLAMVSLPVSPLSFRLFNWHKWAGVSVLALSALRLLWRWTHRPPADLPMPAWQVRAAHAVHGLLYLLFFAVPLAGWAYSSAAGRPVVLFGLWPLPDLVAPDRALAGALKPWHARLAWTLASLVLLHLAAVAKHQWLDGHALLARMWPLAPRKRAWA